MDVKVISVIVIILIAICASVIRFVKLSKEQKIANLKEYLKLCVVEAEKELGSGTGQLKLRRVYEMAIASFPWVQTIIPFETFTVWVDDALSWLNNQLDANKAIKEYIEN